MNKTLTMLLMASSLFLFSADLLHAEEQKWVQVAQSDGVTVYSKEMPGTDYLAFKGIVVVDAPIQKVLYVIVDNDHKKDWVKSLKTTTVLQKIDEYEAVVYQAYELPWYVSDRDFVIRGKVTMNHSTGIIYVSAKSEVHPKAPKTVGVRAELIRSHFTLIPVANGSKTRVELETLGSPKGWIPDWLVNMIQKEWPVNSLSALRNQLKKPHVKAYPLPPKKTAKKASKDPKKAAVNSSKKAPAKVSKKNTGKK
jgi:hypothetical protein